MNALLPWHASLWSRLAPRIVEARLPHALLLCGPTGVGKAGFAQVLTQSLLCEKVQADGYACGNCNACHLFAIGNHPDLLYIEPEEDAKTITVDKIRALSAFMNLMPQHARTRVVVVPQA
ncbi:MAG: DNA polymerase III subunit delta', partial [Gammaproteobacteria bacterium]|nr:DNA polymerase III subunit delta' [Gammaproteobacteria bacterium]